MLKKEAAQARLSLFVSKCHIVKNFMSRFKWFVLKLCVLPSCWSIPHFTGQARLSLQMLSLETEKNPSYQKVENERVSVFMANLQESNGLGRALSNRGSNPGGGGGGGGWGGGTLIFSSYVGSGPALPLHP